MKNKIFRILRSLTILLFVFSFILTFAQEKIPNKIKSSNDDVYYQKEAPSNTIRTFDFSKIHAPTTVSTQKRKLELTPFILDSGQVQYLNLIFLSISNNGKTALAVNTLIEAQPTIKYGYIIDLNDGHAIHKFSFNNISNYFFNPEDTKLFYYDNNYIKQLDLINYETKNLFELTRNGLDVKAIFFENNKIHASLVNCCHPRKYHHYSYDLSSNEMELKLYDDFTYPIKNDIEKEFKAITGSSEQKALMLKLIYGDDIKVKPLKPSSKDEYFILKFPKIYIFKKEQLVYSSQLKEYYVDKEGFFNEKDWDINNEKPIQLTDDLNIIFYAYKTLIVLKMDIEYSYPAYKDISSVTFLPSEILYDGRFAHYDDNSGQLYYGGLTIAEISYSKNKIYFIKQNLNMKYKILKQLEYIDSSLYSYYNANINSETIKNQIHESDFEKYMRIRDVNNKITPIFHIMQDSLINTLNDVIKDSIKIHKPAVDKIFNISNYIQDIEAWRLVFENPYSGKDFSLIYPQAKSEAKSNILNNFSDIVVEVKYFFNLLSFTYEPFLVLISNVNLGTSDEFIIPLKDGSLLKNLYLTNNSYLVNLKSLHYTYNYNFERSETTRYFGLENGLRNGNLNYDENIMRYFVNNGKPKYFFNYDFNTPLISNPSKIKGVRIRNLDSSNIDFTFQSKFFNCCPYTSKYYQNHSDGDYFEYLRFDEIPYFINKTSAFQETDITSVYGINKTESLGTINEVNFTGKYNAIYNLVISTNIKDDIDLGLTSANIEILDLKSKSKIKEFNIIELGSYKERIKSVNWDASFSPNGKYLAIRSNTKTYLYETLNWNNILVLENTSGKLYWDCNSYYLGVGNDVISVNILDLLND